MLLFTFFHANKCNLKGILSSFYFIFGIESEAPDLDTQIVDALRTTLIRFYITNKFSDIKHLQV